MILMFTMWLCNKLDGMSFNIVVWELSWDEVNMSVYIYALTIKCVHNAGKYIILGSRRLAAGGPVRHGDQTPGGGGPHCEG